VGCQFDTAAGTPVLWALCFRAAANPGGELLRSANAGASWRRLTAGGIQNQPIEGFAAAAADIWVVAGYQGSTARPTAGATWSQASGLPTGFSAFYLGFTDATHGVESEATGTGGTGRSGSTSHPTGRELSPDPNRAIVTRVRRIFALVAAATGVALALGIGGSMAQVRGEPAANKPCQEAPQESASRQPGDQRLHPRGRTRQRALHDQPADEPRGRPGRGQEALARRIRAGTGRSSGETEPVARRRPARDVVTVTGHVSRPISASGRLSFAKGLGTSCGTALLRG